MFRSTYLVYISFFTCLNNEGCWGWAIIGAGAAGGACAGTWAGGGGGGAAALGAGAGGARGAGDIARPRLGILYSIKKTPTIMYKLFFFLYEMFEVSTSVNWNLTTLTSQLWITYGILTQKYWSFQGFWNTELKTNLLNYVFSKFAIIKQDPVIFSKITAEAYKIEQNQDEPKIMIL